MDNPFQIITDAFAPDYQINLSIQGLDGSIMLTLSNSGRIVAKRMISAEQRNDPARLKRLVQSIQFGIAIEQGTQTAEWLHTLFDGDAYAMCPGQTADVWATHYAVRTLVEVCDGRVADPDAAGGLDYEQAPSLMLLVEGAVQ